VCPKVSVPLEFFHCSQELNRMKYYNNNNNSLIVKIPTILESRLAVVVYAIKAHIITTSLLMKRGPKTLNLSAPPPLDHLSVAQTFPTPLKNCSFLFFTFTQRFWISQNIRWWLYACILGDKEACFSPAHSLAGNQWCSNLEKSCFYTFIWRWVNVPTVFPHVVSE